MRTFFFIVFIILIKTAFSQTDVEKAIDKETKKENLARFSMEAELRYTKNLEEALRLASQKGWVISETSPEGQIIALQGVDEAGFPVYYETLNINAAATTGTDKLWPGGSTGLNLSSSSDFMTGKLGMWDGGRVRTTHQEFTGRVTIVDNPSGISSHATHVAGTLMAEGINPLAKGMSFGIQELKAWDFGNDVSEMSGAAPDLLVSNHSYGAIAGWRFNSSRAGTAADPNWEWWGDPNISTYEDYKFGYYNSKARDWDHIAYNAPYYLIVKSAGNDRNTNGPAIGSPYWQRTSGGSWQHVSAREEGAISDNDSYDILSAYANAKNILLVGAVLAIPDGYSSPSDVEISTFSSWGPTDDGRIKPDVVANGVGLLSAASTGDGNYRTASGTSMSAPNASGSLMLLQELYHQVNGSFMLSSTLRGLVCHTANEAGNQGPDFIHGWGLLNMEGAANIIVNEEGLHHVGEIALHEGDTIEMNFVAQGTGPLVVTICWTDPKGTPLPYGPDMLNNRTPMLVNDLDLRIMHDTISYKPWVLDVEHPSFPAFTGDNFVDNIEQVYIETPVPGQIYTVMISHKGSLEGSVQVLSLIASNVGGVPVCPSYALSDADTRIDGFYLNTIENLTDSGCHTYRDYTHLATELHLGAAYPFSVFAGTCGAENDRMIKIFADWNSDGIFDSNELVATSEVISATGSFEGNLTVPAWVQPGYSGRLRIVLSETTDPSEINSCGAYQAGETQDYLLNFNHPLIDAGLVKLTYPANEVLCASDNEWFELEIRNAGLTDMTDILIAADIYENGQPILTMTDLYTDTLAPFQTRLIQLNGGFTTVPDKHYDVTFTIHVEDDYNSSNDTLEFSFITVPFNDPAETYAFMCEGSDSVTLKASSSGRVFWYDAPSNGNLLASGDSLTISAIPGGNIIYAGVNTLSDSIGAPGKDDAPWINGAYQQATATPFITTWAPLVIKSATLYVGWPGQITFRIEDVDSDEIVAETTLDVKATRNPASPVVGASNDPDDEGREYLLNLKIPEPGNYRIQVEYSDGATLYRNNSSAFDPYPYVVPGVMAITGSSAGLPSHFYYWLYNMKIESLGCRSEIVETPIQVFESPLVEITSITNPDSTVTLNAGNPGSLFLWSTGDTTQTIVVDQAGYYTVWVTNQWGCTARDSIAVSILGTMKFKPLPIKIYPNPTDDFLVIESSVPVYMELYNANGLLVKQEHLTSTKTTLNVSALPSSIYLLRIFEPEKRIQMHYRILIN